MAATEAAAAPMLFARMNEKVPLIHFTEKAQTRTDMLMRRSETTRFAAWSLQLALLLVSALLVLLPWFRRPGMEAVFFILFFGNCARVAYRGWKAGHLRRTPREVFDEVHAGRVPRMTPLDKAATTAGFIAVLVLMLGH